MNTNELKQILTQAEKIGLSTMGQLLKLCHVCKWNTNRDKINGVNDVFCRDWWETAGLIDYIKGGDKMTATEMYIENIKPEYVKKLFNDCYLYDNATLTKKNKGVQQ